MSYIPLNSATQADQETATSTTTFVSPGRQQFHPSAFKFWVRGDNSTTINASYNVASVTDDGVGNHVYNFTTAFSSVNYFACAMGGAGCFMSNDFGDPTASAIRIFSQTASFVGADAGRWWVGGAGDQ